MSVQSAVVTTTAGPRPPGDAAPPVMVLRRLIDEATRALDADRDAARGLLHRAAALLGPEPSAADLPSGLAPWQARKVLAHIDDNLDGPIAVGDLARAARLSVSYFSRAFKETYGEPPHAFILGRRVSHAQLLMISGDEALSQIAVACGFADQAHFSRVFKRATGANPKAWRRTRRCAP
ncbi:helix-turn-helix transcriptional regulator [Phenylobacterium sp.]|uniref:helix-turn-helix transcriptional regulator n=1 Tax=Phenylobacterium sp. TaxID=1871053 RepID=UPI0035B13AD8